MRRFLGLLLLSVVSVPAFAADSPKPKPPASHHARMTWEKHFALADQAHDGHLTLAEAKGGDTSVAKHFSEIDVSHKGYVTEEDVRAWRETHKTKHRTSKPHKPVQADTGKGTGAMAAATPPAHPPSPPAKN